MGKVSVGSDAVDLLFQSLFSWNLLLMQIIDVLTGDKPEVSILVFVELALDGLRPPAARACHQVSILVFVELALDVR